MGAPIGPQPNPAGPVGGSAPPPTARPPGALARAGSSLRNVGKNAGKGLGYISAAGGAIGAANEAYDGNYGAAAQLGAQAALDTAAAAAPTPVTVGAAITGHAASAALDTNLGRAMTEGLANNLPGSGRAQVDQAIQDMGTFIGERDRQGLPIGGLRDRLTAVENMRAQDFGNGVVYLDPANPYTRNQGPIQAGATRGDTAAGMTAPAIEPPQTMRPDRATSAATKDWSEGARAAMNSTAPGTAVINGRIVGADEIKALENRNVLSSAPLAPGVAYSMLTGGGTLPLGAGPTRGTAAARLGAGFIDREYSGGIGGPPTPAEARRRETDALARQIVSLAESGRTRSAAALTALYRETVGRQNAEIQAAGRARSPVEDQLALAQAGRADADASVARLQADQAQRAAIIQEQLLNEPDLKKRQQLEWTLAAMRGQGVTQARERMQRLKIPVGQGIDARDVELPYDPDTNQLVVPQGLAELMAPPKPKEKK